ncbi:hypothetical protein JCM11251_007441 [Rhodosporidiobolus azoricus]
MSFTTDNDKLFKTDAQHEKDAIRAAKSGVLAERGAPIKLSSKPLRLVVREQAGGKEAEAWVAESGFVVRRVGLESGKTKQLYKGHNGPVTSLDFYTTPSGRELMISGSWDKSFRVWDFQTKTCLSSTIAHIDFIKTLHVIPSLHILLTGSSDKDLRIWDLRPLDALASSLTPASTPSSVAEVDTPPTPAREGAAPPPAIAHSPLPCLLALKCHTRPIEVLSSLALYEPLPEGTPEDEVDLRDRQATGRFLVVSADTMGAVKLWEVWRDEQGEVKGELRSEVRHHESGIWDMVVGQEGELWTASADNSLLLSRLSLSSASLPPAPVLRIPHPCGVRALFPLHVSPSLLSLPTPPPHYLVSGGSDELLRVFDLSSSELDPDPTREQRREWRGLPLDLAKGEKLEGCANEIEAHLHEVIQLRAYTASTGEGGRKEIWVLSASLDGTLRRWRWEELRDKQWDKVVVVPVAEEEPKEGLLTAEEEAELEALMADD